MLWVTTVRDKHGELFTECVSKITTRFVNTIKLPMEIYVQMNFNWFRFWDSASEKQEHKCDKESDCDHYTASSIEGLFAVAKKWVVPKYKLEMNILQRKQVISFLQIIQVDSNYGTYFHPNLLPDKWLLQVKLVLSSVQWITRFGLMWNLNESGTNFHFCFTFSPTCSNSSSTEHSQADLWHGPGSSTEE